MRCFASIVPGKERKEHWSAKRILRMHTLPKDLVRGKKTSQCFEEHQQTYCHKSPASYHVVIPKCKDVFEMTNDNPVNVRKKKESIYLM